jgi:hypothetical protein
MSSNLIDYCSQADSNGDPRLNTDHKCRTWCKTQTPAYGGDCALAAKRFCDGKNQNHPSCDCYHFKTYPVYESIHQRFPDVPEPICWSGACTIDYGGPHAPLRTPDQIAEQPQCSPNLNTFCGKIVGLQKAGKIRSKVVQDLKHVCKDL